MSKLQKVLQELKAFGIGVLVVVGMLAVMVAVHFVNAWFMGVGQ